jgi:hypothetical protein
LSASNDHDTQAKEVMRQEQFWFTATTLGFIGFVGALLKTPTFSDMLISLVLIWFLSAFTVYLVVGRHKAYCALNKTIFSGWRKAFGHAIRERSGALYCVVVVSFAAIGFTLIIFMRYLTPIPQTQAIHPPTSAVAPATIFTTSVPAHKA